MKIYIGRPYSSSRYKAIVMMPGLDAFLFESRSLDGFRLVMKIDRRYGHEWVPIASTCIGPSEEQLEAWWQAELLSAASRRVAASNKKRRSL
jgi:hypothetical protein